MTAPASSREAIRGPDAVIDWEALEPVKTVKKKHVQYLHQYQIQLKILQ